MKISLLLDIKTIVKYLALLSLLSFCLVLVVSITISRQPSTPTISSPALSLTISPAAANIQSRAAAHSTPSDCWIIYNSQLYNITPYFGQHPGGDAILGKYCGQDATTAFNTKDRPFPQSHSDFAKSLLQRYLVP